MNTQRQPKRIRPAIDAASNQHVTQAQLAAELARLTAQLNRMQQQITEIQNHIAKH